MSSKETGTLALSPLPDLPDEILAGIALVIIKHSIMEEVLTRSCYLLAGVDDIVGRLAVREPRPADRLDMIVDLATHRHFKPTDTRDLRNRICEATKQRDTLAHGLFFHRPQTGEILVRLTYGNWSPKGSRGSIKRKIKPSGKTVTRQALNELADLLYTINEELLSMHRQIAAALQAQPK